MMNTRDLELLSSYLDGQLTPTESARLESRIAADPEMESALADLRAARNILRKLPQRKAPRNFTLTRKMVGQNPPLPRAYSFFQFSTAFASLLLVFTFALNVLTPRLNYVGPINTGWGGMGGGAAPQMMEEAAAPAAEAPALEMPAAAAPEMEALPTASADIAPMAKESGQEVESAPLTQPEANPPAAPIPVSWQALLLAVGFISAAVMFVLREQAKRTWR